MGGGQEHLDFSEVFGGSRVLITGGLGFIGSNLAIRLVELGARVLLVDSLTPEYGGNLYNVEPVSDRVQVNISDVRDEHSMRYLVRDRDFLFNLAGQTSHLDSMREPFTDLEINSRAQLSILEACRKHNPGIKIVFAGTRQIYGRPDYLPVDERHLIRPADVNGINKAAGERYHILYNDVYGIRTCALRMTNTFGPRMRVKDSRQTFLGIWIRLLVEGEPFEVWGGEQKRDLNYIDDAVDAFLAAAAGERANGKIYNLGSAEVVSLRQLADMIIEANGGGRYEVRSFPEERRKIDIGDYYSDFGLIRRELGWQPGCKLLEGLRRTLQFYKENIGHYL